jgi:hypothetical protein
MSSPPILPKCTTVLAGTGSHPGQTWPVYGVCSERMRWCHVWFRRRRKGSSRAPQHRARRLRVGRRAPARRSDVNRRLRLPLARLRPRPHTEPIPRLAPVLRAHPRDRTRQPPTRPRPISGHVGRSSSPRLWRPRKLLANMYWPEWIQASHPPLPAQQFASRPGRSTTRRPRRGLTLSHDRSVANTLPASARCARSQLLWRSNRTGWPPCGAAPAARFDANGRMRRVRLRARPQFLRAAPLVYDLRR